MGKSRYSPKMDFMDTLGHAGSVVSTYQGIKSSRANDKAYQEELAARGKKGNFLERNAKTLTTGAAGLLSGLASNYISQKTGLAGNKKWYSTPLKMGLGYATGQLGNAIVNKPIDHMRRKRLEKLDARMQAEQDEPKKKNWIQRNKKLLIAGGIAAGLGAGGYFLGKHLANKANAGKLGKLGDAVKKKIDNSTIVEDMNKHGLYRYGKDMNSEKWKNLKSAYGTSFKKNHQGFLDRKVKERLAGYGLGIGTGAGLLGAKALMKNNHRPEEYEESTNMQSFISKVKKARTFGEFVFNKLKEISELEKEENGNKL